MFEVHSGDIADIAVVALVKVLVVYGIGGETGRGTYCSSSTDFGSGRSG